MSVDCPAQLLVALVSAYRYKGSRVHDESAKSEAEALHHAIKKNLPIEDEEVVRILSTRSKLHLKAIFSHYKELFGKDLDEVHISHFGKSSDKSVYISLLSDCNLVLNMCDIFFFYVK